MQGYLNLYNNQINARALIGQFAVGYCAGKLNPRKNRASSYRREEFVNHSPAARGLQILLVFYQHPAWFISFVKNWIIG